MPAISGVTISGSEDDDIFITFSDAKKREMLNTLKLSSESDIAKRLLFMTEYCLEEAWHRYFYAHDRVNYKKSLEHVKKLKRHIDNILTEIEYIENNYPDTLFWGPVLANKHREIPQLRWSIYNRMSRDLHHAYHFLDKYVNKEPISYVNTDFGSKELDQEIAINGTLFELSRVYFTVTGKKPGRSKSTVGPFVRYAYSVLSELTLYQVKSIDSLNDRWAASKESPQKIALNLERAREYALKKGVVLPF